MNSSVALFAILSFFFDIVVVSSSSPQEPPIGDIQQAYELLDRIFAQRPPFQLELVPKTEGSKAYFQLSSPGHNNVDGGDNGSDDAVAVLLIQGTTVNDITAGIGHYLQSICNMTLGWGAGGSHVVVPNVWPRVRSDKITKYRNVPWSYLMNVCTHSYTLVWYDWKNGWEPFLDYLALKGVNNILALTGQEEVQYKVFRQIGLSDLEIRTWFNGPAFLTWSRGQNEYGNNIAGPLPRKSWMQTQWTLQKDFILPRLKALGIVGQLPGFQGNVPIQVKKLYPNAKITTMGDTGWMDSLDPLFETIADLWMKILIEDFGMQDHWYQMDGYFNGGTAPWFMLNNLDSSFDEEKREIHQEDSSFSTASRLLRRGREEVFDLREKESRVAERATIPHNDTWYHRGAAAYQGLNRTDPDAVWSFQGFSFVGWSTLEQAGWLKGFVDSAPPNKFVIIDMSYGSVGEWKKQWSSGKDGRAFFGASFIWTVLPNFGGVDGIKGDVNQMNEIPFEAFDDNKNDHKQQQQNKNNIVGSGGTPEGLNQNPWYYEFLFQQPFRTEPISDLTLEWIQFAMKRYNSTKQDQHQVTQTWYLLLQSLYSTARSVQDVTAIGHMKPNPSSSLFDEADRRTPKLMACQVYQAWVHILLLATTTNSPKTTINAPLAYDVVNIGREVLAQLSIPAALNFSDATTSGDDESILRKRANFYTSLLADVDKLVATNDAFLLGPWLESARQWGNSYDETDDCGTSMNCTCFYEWNARSQISTWIPVPSIESCQHGGSIPNGPIDYAAKHWSGLISDYYIPRVRIVYQQSLIDKNNANTNQTKVNELLCEHAYEWTRKCSSQQKYPTKPIGDTAQVSLEMWSKYRSWFSSCNSDDEESLEQKLLRALARLDLTTPIKQ